MYNITLCLTYLIYEKYILNTTDSRVQKVIAIKKMNYLKAFFRDVCGRNNAKSRKNVSKKSIVI